MVSLDFQTKSKLAPTGRLRVGIAVGDAISAVWTKRDPATGQPRGPTVDLAQIFSKRTGLPLVLVEYASSGEIIEAASSGNWDVSFTPVDDERKAIVDFGPNLALGESTYMVPKGSAISNLDDVDRPGVRVFGVENTATIRSSRRSLKNTSAVGLASLSEVLEKFRGGKADAIALGKESLISILPEFPGARILDGNFLASGTAVAVPRGNAVALRVFSELVEELKANGTIRRVFDKHGMTSSTVAPPDSRY